MKLFILAAALMSFFAVVIAGPHRADLPTCKEETLKCGGGNPGGAVFVCRKGRWEVLLGCGTGESCVSDPVPTCTWAKTDAEDTVTGFEISDDLVAADVKENGVAAPSVTADNKDTDCTKGETANVNSDGPYYNICSPCIRFNDHCKSQCQWQGTSCDIECNSQTCRVNLTTGDWRQPTVSCGHFCKWQCPHW